MNCCNHELLQSRTVKMMNSWTVEIINTWTAELINCCNQELFKSSTVAIMNSWTAAIMNLCSVKFMVTFIKCSSTNNLIKSVCDVNWFKFLNAEILFFNHHTCYYVFVLIIILYLFYLLNYYQIYNYHYKLFQSILLILVNMMICPWPYYSDNICWIYILIMIIFIIIVWIYIYCWAYYLKYWFTEIFISLPLIDNDDITQKI